jgi:Secretion system C-terminal sorting domain
MRVQIFTGSEDNGATWNRVSFNLNFVNSVLWRPGKMFVGGHFIFDEGLYESTDGGIMWNPTVIDYTLVNTLEENGTRLFAGTDSMGILISDDAGLNWTQTPLTTQNVTDIYVFEDYVFAGTYQSGLFVSHNNGMNWEPKNGGLAVNSIENITKHVKYIFLATRGGVYRTHLNEILGIEPVSTIIPDRFELFQNYPNPFNPSTTIKFDIPISAVNVSGHVKIVMFDAIGREVSTLVDENLRPGSYNVEWNAASFPSGVYFYRLETGDFSAIKKMILVK